MAKNIQIHWFCSTCDHLAMSAVKTDLEIEQKCKKYCSELEEKITKVESDVAKKANQEDLDALTAKVDNIEKSMQNMAKDVSDTSNKITLASTEHEEKQKRSKNLLIRGLPETSLEKQKEAVDNIFESIGFPHLDIEKIQRIGKKSSPEDSARPVKVTLASEEIKWKVIAKAPKIRDSTSKLYNPKKIFIIPDYTQLEREREAQLRKELKEQRDKSPNDYYAIKKGQVVKIPNKKYPPLQDIQEENQEEVGVTPQH